MTSTSDYGMWGLVILNWVETKKYAILLKTIMKYIALLIFISFLGLAVFSIPAFNHRMDNSMDSCIGSKVDNTPCPTNLVAATIHHISVYQALFNTLAPSVFGQLALFLLLVLVLVLLLLTSKNLLNSKLKFLYQKSRDFDLLIYQARQKFVSWFSLLEHSPPF